MSAESKLDGKEQIIQRLRAQNLSWDNISAVMRASRYTLIRFCRKHDIPTAPLKPRKRYASDKHSRNSNTPIGYEPPMGELPDWGDLPKAPLVPMADFARWLRDALPGQRIIVCHGGDINLVADYPRYGVKYLFHQNKWWAEKLENRQETER